MSSSIVRQEKKKEYVCLSSAFSSILALNVLDDDHPYWGGGQSILPSPLI